MHVQNLGVLREVLDKRKTHKVPTGKLAKNGRICIEKQLPSIFG